MDTAVRGTLKRLINEHGTGLCTDWRRLEAFLNDLCGGFRAEVNVLVTAAREGIPSALLGMPSVDAVQFKRLVRRLRDNTGMMDEFAGWAVESWALALGKRSGESDSLVNRGRSLAKLGRYREAIECCTIGRWR